MSLAGEPAPIVNSQLKSLPPIIQQTQNSALKIQNYIACSLASEFTQSLSPVCAHLISAGECCAYLFVCRGSGAATRRKLAE